MSGQSGKASVVRGKSYAFALRIIELARRLRKQREYELASQVLRAGTSIGANVEEAQAGSSRAEIVGLRAEGPPALAKMSIASKEARESHYWLRLLRDSRAVPVDHLNTMIQDVEELIRILTAIVKTGRTSK